MVTIYIFSYLFHIISDIISQNGIYDMILYHVKFWDRRYDIISHFGEKSYHIYIFFSFEIIGEFIYSSKAKKVWHCCLVCLSKIKYLSCYRGAMNSIKLETFNYKVQFRVENSIKSKKYFYFISSKSCKSENISIKTYVGACLVLLGWFDC